MGRTSFDGVGQERYPSYFRFNGTQGVRLAMDNRGPGSRLDYFIRAWLRPMFDIRRPNNQSQVFLDIQNSFRCYFNQTNTSLSCAQLVSDVFQTASMSMPVNDIFSYTWIHFAVAGSVGGNTAYIQLDYIDQIAKIVTGPYLPLQQNINNWAAFLGIGQNLSSGFVGDIREFFFQQGYIIPDQIKFIRNQVMFWATQQIANYRMKQGTLFDVTRFWYTGQVIAAVNSTMPYWDYDRLPVDMCNKYTGYTALPRINTDAQPFGVGQIDARLQPVSYFMYSGSFWMKTFPGIRTTTQAQQARDKFFFFRLHKSFSLWFQNPTTIRMYFEAVKSFQEAASDGIYFPQGQWANFQFQIDRQIGYDMRVYNSERQEIARTTKRLYLYDQKPNGQFNLISNFQGMVKQIMIWSNMQSLPIYTSNGQTETLKDNALIIYYKFDSWYWQGNSLPSLAYNGMGTYGPTVSMNGQLSFQLEEWDQSISYNNPINYGRLPQQITLYDGLACQDNNLVYRMNNGWLNQTIGNFSQMTEATVEFWIKRNTPLPNQLSYLFSVYHQQLNTEFLSIYQATDDLLYCQPFESNIMRNLTVKYSNYTINNMWLHIMCSFRTNSDIIGGLYNTFNDTEAYYSTDLSNTNQLIPNGTLSLIIGGRFNGQFAQAHMYIKEFKFWTVARSIQQVIRNRFVQVDPLVDRALMVYFKFTDGSLNIVNYVNLTTRSIAALRYGGQGYESDNQAAGIVCPQYSFNVPRSMYCVRNPYLKQRLLLTAHYLESNQVQWMLQSRNSDIVSFEGQVAQKDFFYEWQSSNQQINSSLTNFYANWSALTLNSSFKDPRSEIWTVKQTINNKMRTFFTDQVLTFQLNPCVYVIDVNSRQPITERWIYSVQGQADLQFTFKVIDVCTPNNTFRVSKTVVDWEVYPSTLNHTGFNWRYDQALDSFILFIPREQQFKIPANEPLTLVATLYFVDQLQENLPPPPPPTPQPVVNNSQPQNQPPPPSNQPSNSGGRGQLDPNQPPPLPDNWYGPGGQSQPPANRTGGRLLQGNNTITTTNATKIRSSLQFLNLVYRLKFIENIRPVIQFPIDQVLIGEHLVLNASESHSLNVTHELERTNGLDYYWTCPDIMASICNQQQGKRILNISYDDFLMSKAQYNTRYNFTVSVFRANDLEPPYVFNQTVSALWLLIHRPDFLIQLTSGPKVLASKDNTFSLWLKNYEINNPQLSISWSFSPDVNQTQFSQLSPFNNTQTLQRGALRLNTTYTLQVFMTHKTVLFANRTVTFTFRTGLGPSIGAITVTPIAGNALQNVFNFSLANWNSSMLPIKFTVTGISEGLPTPFLITQRPYYQNETFQTQLPQIRQIRLEVSDATDEVVVITQEHYVVGTNNPFVNVTGLSEQSALDLLVLQALQIYQMDQVAHSQNIQSNKLYSFNYLAGLTLNYSEVNDNLTEGNLTSCRKIVQILALISNSSQATSDQIQQLATQILQNVQKRPKVFQFNLLNDLQFQANYAQATSHQMKYMFNRFISRKRFRNLQSNEETITSMLKVKEAFADNFCRSINSTYYEVQYPVETELFYMYIEKFSIHTRHFNRTYLYPRNFSTYVQLPINETISHELSQNSSVSTVCLQLTYYKFNPLQSLNFTNQNLTQIPLIQLQSLNNFDQKVWESQPAKYNRPMMVMHLAYNYNDTTLGFRNNQTVVQYIEQINSNQRRWRDSGCDTRYDMRRLLMNISCNDTRQAFYAIQNDYERKLFLPNDSIIDKIIALLLSFDPAVIPVFIFILALILVLPILAICKDRSDYEAIKSDAYEVDDDLIKKVAVKKRLPFEQVLYSKKLFAQYQHTQASCLNLFWLYFKNLHPLLSLFCKFDITLKRLTRFMGLTFQVSILAIISALVFGVHYRQTEFEMKERDESYDLNDVAYAAALAIVMSVLTIPLPNALVACFRSQLVPESKVKKAEKEREERRREAEKEKEKEEKTKKKGKEVEDEEVPPDPQHEGGESEEGPRATSNRRKRPSATRSSKYRINDDDNQDANG